MTVSGERVRQVRELKRLTQTELARAVGVKQASIALIEAGRLQPQDDLFERLSLHLGFPRTFFRQTESLGFPMGSLLFRSHANVPAKEKAEAHRLAQIAFEIADRMARRVRGMAARLPRVDEGPVIAARIARNELALSPDQPIAHLTRAIETRGVIVLALPTALVGTDAFSLWAGTGPRPVIAYSAGKPGDRLRLSVAHEVGHLVLHQTIRESMDEVEREAFRFAGELLMPEDAMRQEIVPPVTLTVLAELKVRWKVSIQALNRRARDLGIITDRQYRYFQEQLTVKGWRTNEPENLRIPAERPRAFRKMAEVLYGTPIDVRAFAAEHRITPYFATELLAQYDGDSELMPTDSLQSQQGNVIAFPDNRIGQTPSGD